MITVKQLIEQLKDLPQDAFVIQASDPEGNSYSPTWNLDVVTYDLEGNIGISELTEELTLQGYTDEDIIDGPIAVCLWPTN